MTRFLRIALLLTIGSVGLLSSRASAQIVGTMRLDGLSFVSFENLEILPIPTGSTIKFHFGAPGASGAIPFTVAPGDVAIAPLRSSAGTLQYGLAKTASGTMVVSGGTATLDMIATVSATLSAPTGGGTTQYTVHFSTQQAAATNLAGTKTVSLQGQPLVLSARYVQLVAALTNNKDASPEPGKVVTTVLSGTFDQLP